jgi:hypothetical protein
MPITPQIPPPTKKRINTTALSDPYDNTQAHLKQPQTTLNSPQNNSKTTRELSGESVETSSREYHTRRRRGKEFWLSNSKFPLSDFCFRIHFCRFIFVAHPNPQPFKTPGGSTGAGPSPTCTGFLG